MDISVVGTAAISDLDNDAQEIAEGLVALGGAAMLGYARRLAEMFRSEGHREAAARWEAIGTIMRSIITEDAGDERDSS